MYRIALCIVSYNRRPYTERTLAPLLEQLEGGEHDLHIFVYDNASSDSTPEYLREIEARHEKVTVVLGDENIGVTNATKHLLEEHVFNQGFDFIAKNDDDELLPDDWMGEQATQLFQQYHDLLVEGAESFVDSVLAEAPQVGGP